MFPKQQQQDEEDTIELLSSTEKLQVPKQRHVRTGSASSFIHFKAPVQKEQVDSQVTHPNRLASQALPSLIICVIGLVFAGWMMDIYQVRNTSFPSPLA